MRDRNCHTFFALRCLRFPASSSLSASTLAFLCLHVITLRDIGGIQGRECHTFLPFALPSSCAEGPESCRACQWAEQYWGDSRKRTFSGLLSAPRGPAVLLISIVSFQSMAVASSGGGSWMQLLGKECSPSISLASPNFADTELTVATTAYAYASHQATLRIYFYRRRDG